MIEEAAETDGVVTAVAENNDDGEEELVDDSDDAIDKVFFTEAVALPLA